MLRPEHELPRAVGHRQHKRADEYYNEWRTEWKKTRRSLDDPTTDEIIAEAEAEQAAWNASELSKNVAEGNIYIIEVMTTGSPDAVPLPKNVFDCSRDERVEVERVAEPR